LLDRQSQAWHFQILGAETFEHRVDHRVEPRPPQIARQQLEAGIRCQRNLAEGQRQIPIEEPTAATERYRGALSFTVPTGHAVDDVRKSGSCRAITTLAVTLGERFVSLA
jgi:hypothetical protein